MSETRLVFDQKERVAAWTAERAGHYGAWGDFYAMGAERDGELICGLVFNGFPDTNVFLHFAFERPTKLLPELILHAYVYAFGQIKRRRVTGFVEANKRKALRVAKRLGFIEEGVMHQAGANGEDILVLVLWPQNFRGRK